MLLRVLKKLYEYIIPKAASHTNDAPTTQNKFPIESPPNATLVHSPVHSKVTIVEAYVGDITEYEGDAIVNAANTHLLAGGGVCGAIFSKAGEEVLQESCNLLGVCETGCAVTTPGFALNARFIIHAVGPIYEPGQDNAALLASAYENSLREAIKAGAKSIAFPAISTGIYGYPLEEATAIATSTIGRFCQENPSLDRVSFCCFSQEIFERYSSYLSNNTKTLDVSNEPGISS